MKHFLFGILSCLQLTLAAQNGKFNLGARHSGLAGSSVTIGDQYSLFNNVGGLALVTTHSVFGGYQNRFGIREFQVVGAGAIYHSDIGNAGVGFYKFGDDLFSQQRLHLAIGNKLQMISLGLGADLIQYNVAGVGTKQAFAIQFGGIAEITSKFHFGAHIFNLNQVNLVESAGERIPTVMKAGFSYRPNEELMINVEVEKDLDFEEIIKAGLEYQVIEKVFLRTGISTDPFISAYGIGFHPKKLLFDYSYSNDSNLGNIHEVSIAFSFQK